VIVHPSDLEDRLVKLERRPVLSPVIGLGLGILLTGGVLVDGVYGQGPSPVVEAQQFVLVDGEGKQRALLQVVDGAVNFEYEGSEWPRQAWVGCYPGWSRHRPL
jgi:hypothetical protein